MMRDSIIMTGFPPLENEQVTLENWRISPFNQWSLHHVREIIPTAVIPNNSNDRWILPERPVDLSQVVFIDGQKENTFRGMIDGTDNDALVVLHRGAVIFEEYSNGMDASSQHILFSVSKSLTAIMVGIAEGQGLLDVSAPIIDYIPELKESAYGTATVRHLLDMTAGTDFIENYEATEGQIIHYREASGWNPRTTTPSGLHLRGFLMSMKGLKKEHGGQFRYLSPNTDVLGWILERATNTRFVDFVSDTLWQPMGAGRDAYITIDGEGAPRTAGGLCITARDLALVGQLILEGGERNGKQILPLSWIEDTRDNGSIDEWNSGEFADDFPEWLMRYRNKWYVMGDSDAPILGIGIHGQFLFIDPSHDLVCVKFSSSPDAVNNFKEKSFLFACYAIGKALDAGYV